MVLRPYDPADAEAVIALWRAAKAVAYPYLPTEQGYTIEDDTRFFRERIEPNCDIWLAVAGDELLGYLALNSSYLDRLYIHPDHQRGGVGAALLEKAKELSPNGLKLHTHQQNISACSFYEKHGFKPASFGTSGPPESMPDVEYQWRP
jgi:GNAT superfamily N-acetyltransferase